MRACVPADADQLRAPARDAAAWGKTGPGEIRLQRRANSVARYRAAFERRNLVAELEALQARAFPPLTVLDLDGWQLRSSGDLILRANSVWPRADGARLSLDERLRQVESFYRQGGAPAAVQVSPSARPAGLAAALIRRGYRPGEPLELRTRRVDGLGASVPAAGSPAEAPNRAPASFVRLVGLEDWLLDWGRAAGATERSEATVQRVLERVALPAAYALVAQGGDVAVARGVVDGGWLGVDLMAATPALRTAAVGAAVLGALGGWAARRGAERAHVEVGDPQTAVLTAGSGFRCAYELRYYTSPG